MRQRPKTKVKDRLFYVNVHIIKVFLPNAARFFKAHAFKKKLIRA